MKVTIYTDNGILGPLNAGPIRMFWSYGIIPKGTLVTTDSEGSPLPIEACEPMNKFAKFAKQNAEHFNGNELLSQRSASTRRQWEYLAELGWPFPVQHLNYYQLDFLRKELEKLVPTKRRLFADPENPWTPKSFQPLNLTDDEAGKLKYLSFLRVEVPPEPSIEQIEALIAEHGSLEKEMEWRDAPNAWKALPATNRQIKFLKFFGYGVPAGLTRGLANKIIYEIRLKHENVKSWEDYKALTGDEDDESAELRKYDPAKLGSVRRRTRLNADEKGERKRIWEFLVTPALYSFTWIKMTDMDTLLEDSDLTFSFRSGDHDSFRQAFLSRVEAELPQVAFREAQARKSGNGRREDCAAAET